MTSRLNRSISFAGNARDAMAFYGGVFGGTASVPLETQMWGDEFGMCVDQFGSPWMVNIGQPQG